MTEIMKYFLNISSVCLVLIATNISLASAEDMLPDGKPIPEDVKTCLKSSNTTIGELLKKPSERTDAALCFAKCILEITKLVDEDGNILLDKIDLDQLDIPEEMKDDLMKCIASVGPVKECQDMKKLNACSDDLGLIPS